MSDVRKSLAEHLLARRQLLDRYPQLADDEPTLLDTLDGISDLREQIIAVIESADDDAMLIEGIKTRLADLNARASRLAMRVERKHQIARDAMELGNMRKIEAGVFTLSLAKSQRAVIITDETLIPTDFMVQPPPKPDKRAIKAALVEIGQVPGAVLNNPADHLVIRRS